ncbi:MAG: hypothetical protein JSS96_17400, partial [Bacteroidetes bacterium]|nr:hypothetical protein [Bacteroidota bacterium]
MKLSCFLFIALMLLPGLDAHGQENLYIEPVSPEWMGQCDFVFLEIGDTFSKGYYNTTNTYYKLFFKKNKLKYWNKSVGHGVVAYATTADGDILIKEDHNNHAYFYTYFTSTNFKDHLKKQWYYNHFLSILDSNFFDI